jgi:hypothetical protein
MTTFKRVLIAAGIAASLVMIPGEVANAYGWGAGSAVGPWRHAYVHDPGYRWGSPTMRSYIRDLYRYGPEYAQWRQTRRFGWW